MSSEQQSKRQVESELQDLIAICMTSESRVTLEKNEKLFSAREFNDLLDWIDLVEDLEEMIFRPVS